MSETLPPTAIASPPVGEHDALPAGTRFGELEILRVVGVGGFGIVYLARDHSLDRDVALKEYMPGQMAARGPNAEVSVRSDSHMETFALGLRSFVNEARLLARFDHPSLVKVYRFWEANNTAYMVMPFLQGQTLREARRSMPLPPNEQWLRRTLNPLLEALEILHKEAVYHRDIAPDNIFLPSDGSQAVLLDFGAARRAIGDSTQTFTAILKPSYAPIEQYAESVSLRQGPWTDVYALGAVMHYLLKGVPPPPATARMFEDHSDVLAELHFPDVSQVFLAAVDWALAVRPQDRPQSVAEFRDALDGKVVPPVHSPRKREELKHSADTFLKTVPDPTLPAVRKTHEAGATTNEATVVLGGLAVPTRATEVANADLVTSAKQLASSMGPRKGSPKDNSSRANHVASQVIRTRPIWPWAAMGLFVLLANGAWWWKTQKTQAAATPTPVQAIAVDKPASRAAAPAIAAVGKPVVEAPVQAAATHQATAAVKGVLTEAPTTSKISAIEQGGGAPRIVLEPRPKQMIANQGNPSRSVEVDTGADKSKANDSQVSPMWPSVPTPGKEEPRPQANSADPRLAEKTPASPAEVCEPLSFFRRLLCLKSECGTERFFGHPQCVRMRAQEEAERQRRLGRGNR